MSEEKTPGQASYEARQVAKGRRMGAGDDETDAQILAVIALSWGELPAGMQADEEAGAQAAIDTFLAGDSVSAASIREALAAREYEPGSVDLPSGWREDQETDVKPAPELAVMREAASRELAAAMRETRAMCGIVCNLLDLFGAPDDRLMQHASVTRATLQRYAADAGVRLDGRAGP